MGAGRPFFYSGIVLGAFTARSEPLNKEVIMLKWAIIFAIIAFVAGIFGFTGVSAGAAGIAKILFIVFVVLFLIMLARKSSSRINEQGIA